MTNYKRDKSLGSFISILISIRSVPWQAELALTNLIKHADSKTHKLYNHSIVNFIDNLLRATTVRYCCKIWLTLLFQALVCFLLENHSDGCFFSVCNRDFLSLASSTVRKIVSVRAYSFFFISTNWQFNGRTEILFKYTKYTLVRFWF